MTTTICPSCKQATGGKFCRHCGAAVHADPTTQGCTNCGAALRPDARFCNQCGRTVGAGAAGASGAEKLRWFLAGGATVAVAGALVLLLTRTPVASAGQPAPATVATQPRAPDDGFSAADLAAMGPKQRFDALYNRIMRSSERGDEASVGMFAPMALASYAELDSVDADARYHAALIYLHTGGVAEASALADTILKKQPGHLFGYVVKGTLARFQQDSAGLKRAYKDFLAHYDAEQKAARVEYTEHPRALADFLANAREATGGSTP